MWQPPKQSDYTQFAVKKAGAHSSPKMVTVYIQDLHARRQSLAILLKTLKL